jgi:hypothetical protein
MADIIGTVLDVALKLFGLRGKLSEARQARKKEVAEFLYAIAKNIEDVSASLKQGIYPHGTCQILLSHSNQMEQAIGDLIGERKARDLGNQLEEVKEIESLYDELNSKPEKERTRSLHVLDQAAGLFRATGDIVKVSP